MTKVDRVKELLKTTDYQGKLKKDVDAWIAEQVGCCIGIVQKLRQGWYQKRFNSGDRRKLTQALTAQKNLEMAKTWKAPKRVRVRT